MNTQAKTNKKKHKFKINEAVYILYAHRLKRLSRRRYCDDYDSLYLVIDYIESWPHLSNEERKEYIAKGYEYVISYVDREDMQENTTARLVPEEKLRKYYGHDYDIEIGLIMEEYDRLIGSITRATPYESLSWDPLKERYPDLYD